jgi:DNA-binding transcriptional LysR family regulator
LTLRHFQIFVAVCDAMNMTAAAKSLFLSQSAVSQAISEMERHYGVRLFERLSRRLYLTEAGENLLGYARHIIRLNRDAEGEMRSLCKNGVIRVGASVTIGSCVLPGLISDFQHENPECLVRVTEDNTMQVEQMILSDRLDLGLVEGETILPDILSRPFLEDTLVLICGAEHPFAGRAWVEPEELERENFILREVGSGTRKTFEDAMNESGLTWKETWTCNNADTIKAAVAAGLGVSVISRRAVRKEAEYGLLHIVGINGLTFRRRFRVVYHKNKYLTEPMKRFIGFCFRPEGRSTEVFC